MAAASEDISAAESEVVRRDLRALITPMIVSFLLVGSTSVVDTFFFSILGDTALAAFSFMLPVLVGVNQVFMGYGIGVTSVVSRALGAGDRRAVARLITHTLLLALALGALLAALLQATESVLFRGLGATDVEQPLIDAFMLSWIPGVVFFVIMTWGTAVLRGLGETRSTALVMLAQAVINVALAPMLMFGIAGVPAMGMKGAGLALTAAAVCGALLTGWFMLKRRELIVFSLSPAHLAASARATLGVALPAVFTYALMPATSAVFTHWLSAFGADAVAAFGIAVRFESFLMMVPLAIAAGLGPFIGQHWGAGELGKVRHATAWCTRLARFWGIGAAALLAVFAVPLATLLADRAALVSKVSAALWIVPLGLASYGAIIVAGSVYNNVGRASRTASFAALRTVLLAVPIGAIGQYAFGLYGLYAALPIASFITERYAARRLRLDHLRPVAPDFVGGRTSASLP